MNNKYFELARNEERSGNDAAALLLYLSSFCDSCNHGTRNRSYGVEQRSDTCSTGLCSLTCSCSDWFTHTVRLRTLSARNF